MKTLISAIILSFGIFFCALFPAEAGMMMAIVGGSGIDSGSTNLVITDDFNRANANPIGGNWTTITDESAIQIISNAALATGDSARNGVRWNANVFNANQSAQVKWIFTSLPVYSGPMVRCSSTAETYYYLAASTTTHMFFYEVVAGASNAMAEFDTLSAITTGDIIKLAISGVTMTAYINGVAQSSYANADIPTGNPGFRLYNSGVTFDDFSASDL